MGGQCVPDSAIVPEDREIMTPERYEKTLADNPELYVHPQHMTPERCKSMHWKLPEAEPEK